MMTSNHISLPNAGLLQVDALVRYLTLNLPIIMEGLQRDKMAAPGFPACVYAWKDHCELIESGKVAEVPLWYQLQAAQARLYGVASEAGVDVPLYTSHCNCASRLGAGEDGKSRCAMEEGLQITLSMDPANLVKAKGQN